MNAAVSLQQRLAIKTMQAIDAQDRAKGVTEETCMDIFFLLTQIYLQAADGAEIAAEFIEGNGDEKLRVALIEKLGFIKSNLVFIGSVINGKQK
jgi:hypothetical protein